MPVTRKSSDLSEESSFANYDLVEKPIHVFISSSKKEYAHTRKRIKRRINLLSLGSKWLFRADLAEDNSSLKSKAGYFDLLDAAAIYLVIIGHKPSKATIEEFDRARLQRKPILAYEFYWAKDKGEPYGMTEFVQRLMNLDINIRGHDPLFQESAELLDKIADDLTEILGIIVNNYSVTKRTIAKLNRL
jgi:hypothetical protein